jgi:hypothetical protein
MDAIASGALPAGAPKWTPALARFATPLRSRPSSRAAARGARREAEDRLTRQGSEQPLAALQDIDVIEHLGERVPSALVVHGRASARSGWIAVGAASRCW